MGFENPNPNQRQYLIIRPEKISWLHILSLFILRRNLHSYEFTETNSVDEDIPTDFITALTLFIQKLLESIKGPLKWLGGVLEFFLNLLSVNGGFFGLLFRIFTVSAEKPNPEAANYRSMIGFIDGRVKLFKANSFASHFYPFLDPYKYEDHINYLDLSGMSAKIAYENAAFVENVVSSVWKMNFVGFFNFWNKFLNDFTTQAFIFTDKATDAGLIVVAFRGTEPFNADDWSTDVNLSWIFANKLGNLHIGFLKALGLQNETSFLLGFPKELIFNDPNKPVAYYAIKDKLRNLLKQHPNAKILVTGHSLGGALACIFPALLSYHNESDIVNSLYGTFTFGQPRVGDRIFCGYYETIMRAKYYRMVYRYDIVPRIPLDALPVSLFKHCGTCIYSNGWYDAKELEGDVPNPNYFDPRYVVPMYLNAIGDLFRSLFVGFKEGAEYKEGIISILFRGIGLLIPGLASHSPRDYINSGRLETVTTKSKV